MNSKKAIETLLKIARNQQKIIEKLAQGRDVDVTVPDQPAPPPPATPPAGKLQPTQTQHTPTRAIVAALPPEVKATLANIAEDGNDMKVWFKPGQKTQANYDAILKVMQELTASNVLQHAYQLVAV
jgi:hypothetical protein